MAALFMLSPPPQSLPRCRDQQAAAAAASVSAAASAVSAAAHRRRRLALRGSRTLGWRRQVVQASATDDPQLTWQLVVGATAGIAPFVVAGIEFSKRIAAQRRCTACGGSGLVKRDEYYFRCYKCGGFLPWQSWKRFFSG